MDAAFVQTLWITFKLAFSTTVILILIGLPISYWLAYSRFKLKPLVEALVSMPMVLPPSVIGYYMLVLYSPRNFFGKWLAETFDLRLAFTFEGVLIASVLFSLPFMIQPLQTGLRSLPESLREASYTLGKSKTTTFFKVLLPNIKPSIITAIALTFAHSIGEFGIVLMVGGNMPGETRVASIAIYDEVQSLNFVAANQYAFILFAVSLVLLTTIYSVNKKYEGWKIM
ncbi:molybdate ABC transporter permease subunit [Flavobacterium alvei]|uniref:Molybdenum transport system permease n=1 Tax=Flavobacterium alvei TaxID=2080416 RepID=A0A2S5A0U8_9FLAO|nr:molybdate ABC transporter permease subunit [Flavobacterium alvei]POY36175.1 molybdate ABC transporter permease subunit [Flavobacterium alvei]